MVVKVSDMAMPLLHGMSPRENGSTLQTLHDYHMLRWITGLAGLNLVGEGSLALYHKLNAVLVINEACFLASICVILFVCIGTCLTHHTSKARRFFVIAYFAMTGGLNLEYEWHVPKSFLVSDKARFFASICAIIGGFCGIAAGLTHGTSMARVCMIAYLAIMMS